MQSFRHYTKMTLNGLGVNFLHRRNPWAALAWSIALPGLGHIYCGSYIRGTILMVSEIFVNQMGRINLAIFLTVLGYPERAQAVIAYQWALLYPLFYILSMWDAYRLSVEINKRYEVERRQETRSFSAISMTTMEINFLDKRNPWLAAFLSAFLFGSGAFYNSQLLKAVLLTGWNALIIINSGLTEAIVSMWRGDWGVVHALIDYQWLLFIPSMYLFSIWDAYVDATSINTLVEEERRWFLKSRTAAGVSAAGTEESR